MEEPLCLLRLHTGFTYSPGGDGAVRDPQPANQWDDRRGGREREREEDPADDQRETSGGEE